MDLESPVGIEVPHPSGSSGCHAAFHPLDHLALVPDDGASTQVDLLGKGALCHLGINELAGHPSHLQDLPDAQEAGSDFIARGHNREEKGTLMTELLP